MILSELRDYIKQRQQVSLADIIHHFDTDEQAARAMLDVWIKKGRIHRKLTSASCGSKCNQCQTTSTEYYIWGPALTNTTYFAEGCNIKT